MDFPGLPVIYGQCRLTMQHYVYASTIFSLIIAQVSNTGTGSNSSTVFRMCEKINAQSPIAAHASIRYVHAYWYLLYKMKYTCCSVCRVHDMHSCAGICPRCDVYNIHYGAFGVKKCHRKYQIASLE